VPDHSGQDGGDRSSSYERRRARGPLEQRSRILRAIVDVVSRDGYVGARVGDVAAGARVSRATFYEQFTGKEECFLAAHASLSEQLCADVAEAGELSDPEAGAAAVVGAVVGFAQRRSDAFSFLTHEATVAGARAFAQRELLLERLEDELARAWRGLPGGAPAPDISPKLIVAGVVRMLGFRIRRGEHGAARLLEHTLVWIDSYAAPGNAHKWTGLTPAPTVQIDDSGSSSRATYTLPRGRHRLAAPVVARIQNERIVRATADVVADRGYANTTVAEIVAYAGISRDTFYAHFTDKRAAFLAAFRQGFEQTLAAALGAFFTSTGDWRERVWDAGRAFTDVLASESQLAYLGFVEAYALGPRDAPRIDNSILGFMVLLEDGYRYRPQATRLPRLVSEAIAGAVAEIAATCVRQSLAGALPALLPAIAYMVLTPYTGATAASEFIASKQSSAES
jgi:AcrR family transcriptional regulator